MKGSAFSLRIGKDIKEARTTNRNEAFKATNRLSGRYKKLEEQKEENRKSYTEKEVTPTLSFLSKIITVTSNQVFIEKPVAPPRSKRDKRQSFKGFKEDRQSLFSSDHTTEDGMDLLPVGRTIAFDCPAEGVHKSDIHVQITGGFFFLPREGFFYLLIGWLIFKSGVGVKVAAGCNEMQISYWLIRRDCPRNFIPHNVLPTFMEPNVTWNNKKAIILGEVEKAAITLRAWEE